MSRVQPFVDDETSWAARRQSYVDTFSDGGFAVLALQDGDLLGYATVRVHAEAQDSWTLGRSGATGTVPVASSGRRRSNCGS